MEVFLLNILAGVLGIVFYSLFKARKYFSEFNLKILWNDRKWAWAWSLTMIVVINIIVFMIPGAVEPIQSITALNLSANPVGFFWLGIGLTGLFKETNKKD